MLSPPVGYGRGRGVEGSRGRGGHPLTFLRRGDSARQPAPSTTARFRQGHYRTHIVSGQILSVLVVTFFSSPGRRRHHVERAAFRSIAALGALLVLFATMITVLILNR